MFNNIQYFVNDFEKMLKQQDIFIFLIIVYIVSTFVYWLISYFLRKRRNDIFDGWMLITVFTMGWGRLSYILGNWSDFRDSYWFYLPYERYGSEVFLFRAMPWRIVTIWDGGFLFTAMLSAFIVSAMLYIILYKRWSVRNNIGPLVTSITTMLGGIFVSYGWLLQDSEFSASIFSGGEILLIVAVTSVIFNIALTLKRFPLTAMISKFRDYANIILLLFLTGYSFLVFTASELTIMDKINLGIFLIAVLIYTVLSIVGYNDVEKVRGQLAHTNAPERNKAIKSKLLRNQQ